ncbi:MAG TPA: DUF262 domain-containing protein, partial [Acidobacteriota bacterium]|nr:DUF262 domain-containing protein [Acidobacteriota bacterium]
KSCLVLSDLPVAYKVQNFNVQNLSTIQRNWDAIKGAIERAVELINSFGIDGNTLASANAVIPLAYYFIQHPNLTLFKETPFDAKNAAAVRCWITMALLNGVFGGSSDNILSKIREVLRNNSGAEDYPFSEINAETARLGRLSYFNEQAVNDYLEITYDDRLSFLALSLLYDDNKWGTIKYHKDHIFPKSMFSWNYMHEAGFSRQQYLDYAGWKNSLANLELLLSYENQEKLDTPFDRWLKTRDKTFLKRHLIPPDPELWKFENFEGFLAEREKLIRGRLELLFGRVETKED